MTGTNTRESLLITPKELSATVNDGRTVVLDVRIGAPDATRDAYLRAHIPGAIATTVGGDFAGAETAATGTLPLPDAAALGHSLARWGIEDRTRVVVYSDNPAAAARAWWVLRWAGLADVRLLDGGLKEWIATVGGTETSDVPFAGTPTENPAPVTGGQLPTLDYADIPDFLKAGLLLDGRPPAGFGTAEAPTHIPGAVNSPADRAWDDNGKLRSDEELRALFGAAGAIEGKPIGAYCGGGVLAAYEVLALKAIGTDAALYVGSWSEWNKRRSASAQEEGAS